MFTKLWDKLKGWKTLLIGVPSLVISVWDLGSQYGLDIRPLIPLDYRDTVYSLILLAMVACRFVTTTPIFRKDD